MQAGSDNAQSTPLREQVERRTGQKVKEQLVDGGYLSLEQIEKAEAVETKLYVPPPPGKNGAPAKTSDPDDSAAVAAWRTRMQQPQAKEIYKERCSTVETVNGDLKTHRGLVQFTVRGLNKVTCVALWSVLAYNLLHFTRALMS